VAGKISCKVLRKMNKLDFKQPYLYYFKYKYVCIGDLIGCLFFGGLNVKDDDGCWWIGSEKFVKYLVRSGK
jgi:hypothetical protein